MASCKAIKGALHNFLGTFTSRYSDYNGYWLFGFLVNHIDEIELPLLKTSSIVFNDASVDTAAILAVDKFRDQAEKAGVLQCISDATLTIRRLSETRPVGVNGHVCEGRRLKVEAVATSKNGPTYRSSVDVLAAPHNPEFELQSSRAMEQ